MNVPFGPFWPVVAGIATGVALVGETAPFVAVPAAALAVVAAGATLATVLDRAAGLAPPSAGQEPPRLGAVRDMFLAGELGREDLVLTLDWLERKGSRPNLPTRSAPEIARLVRLPDEEFLRYLAGRVTSIEGSS